MSSAHEFPKRDELAINPAEDLVAEVPDGISNRDALFDAVKEQLQFPGYFGYNWDAFEELLHDFSWLNVNRVIMCHRQMPDLPEDQLKIYLDILLATNNYWNERREHKFLAVFS